MKASCRSCTPSPAHPETQSHRHCRKTVRTLRFFAGSRFSRHASRGPSQEGCHRRPRTSWGRHPTDEDRKEHLMKLLVKGKNVDVSRRVQEYAEKRLAKLSLQLDDDVTRMELEITEHKNPRVSDNHV